MNRYIQQGMMLANSNAKGFEYGRDNAQREAASGQMQGLVNRDNQGYLSYDPASPALSNPYVVERVKMAIDLDRATQQARQARMLDLIRQMQIDETTRKVAAENNRQSSQEALFARPAVPTGRRFMPDGSQVAVPMTQPRQQSPYIPSAPGGLEPLALPEAGGAGPESLIPPGLDRNTAALMTPDDLSRVVRSRVAPSTTTAGRSPVERATYITPSGKIVAQLSNGSWLINGQPGDVMSLTPEELQNMKKPGVDRPLSASAAKLLMEHEALVDQAEAKLRGEEAVTPTWRRSQDTINKSIEQSRLARDMAKSRADKARGYLLPQSQRGGAPTPTPRPTVTPAPVASPAASPAPISVGGFPASTPSARPKRQAGDVVTLKDGTKKTILRVLPNGTYETD